MTRGRLSVVLAVLILAFGILSWHQLRRASAITEQRRASADADAKLAVQRTALRKLGDDVEMERRRYRELVTKLGGGGRAEAPPPAPPTPPTAQNPRNARIGASPELREAFVRASSDDARLVFGGLLSRLRLAPEQLGQFDAIQADYQNRMLDLAVASQDGKMPPEDLTSARAEVERQREAAYQQLFGSNYDAWTTEVKNLGPRQVVNGIVQSTFSGFGPMTGPQADALTALLASHQSEQEGRVSYEWDSILASAAEALPPEQLDGFKTGVEEYITRLQMNAIIARSKSR